MKNNAEVTMMGWMKPVMSAVVALLLMMGATTASADEIHLELRPTSMETNDPGYTNLLGSSEPSAWGMSLGYMPSMIEGLRALLSLDQDLVSGTRFGGDVDTYWQRQRLMVGADYGIDVVEDRLRPLGRVTVGYAYQELELSADDVTYRDTAHGFSAVGAAGLEATLFHSDEDPERIFDRLSLHLNLLAGYAWQSRANFDEMSSESAPEEPTSSDPWQRASYDAGSMQVSGFVMSLGFVVGYDF